MLKSKHYLGKWTCTVLRRNVVKKPLDREEGNVNVCRYKWKLYIKGISENPRAKGNLSGPKHILISRSFTGADDMYIAYDLFIIFPILRSTLHKLGTTHSCNMHFQYTLLADIFHSSSKFILQELTFFCNLFSLLQEVLGSRLHWCCQHMSLLGASFLLVRWAFVAGVHQSGDLWQGVKMNVQQRDLFQDLKCIWQTNVFLNSFYHRGSQD